MCCNTVLTNRCHWVWLKLETARQWRGSWAEMGSHIYHITIKLQNYRVDMFLSKKKIHNHDQKLLLNKRIEIVLKCWGRSNYISANGKESITVQQVTACSKKVLLHQIIALPCNTPFCWLLFPWYYCHYHYYYHLLCFMFTKKDNR